MNSDLKFNSTTDMARKEQPGLSGNFKQPFSRPPLKRPSSQQSDGSSVSDESERNVRGVKKENRSLREIAFPNSLSGPSRPSNQPTIQFKLKQTHLQQQQSSVVQRIKKQSPSPSPSPTRRGGRRLSATRAAGFIRQRLPIDNVREKIVGALRLRDGTHPTMIFIGEAGCGKSTQIPQMCLEAGLAPPTSGGSIVAVTEPRKVAVLSLARRVAQERGCRLGEEVGYKYRFEDCISESTRLAYMTDGILLREALYDQMLTRYSTIIVDEVHERSLHTDMLLYVLKLAQAQRGKAENKLQPLRLILMSATLRGEKFAEYYGDAPMYYVKGRSFPVELYYAEQESLDSNDYLSNAISTVFQLHESEQKDAGFLVFLTGQDEIHAAMRAMRKAAEEDGRVAGTSTAGASLIYPIGLYASIGQTVQKRVFEPAPLGMRKVIFATNIAETSLTIPGVKVIIDSGKVKQRSFAANHRVDTLRVVNISKEQANQRAGRAGREAPGKCYRLYSAADYDSLAAESVPEILRISLTAALLDLIKMGLRRFKKLKLMDQPDKAQIDAALDELRRLGAVIIRKGGRIMEITESGEKLTHFPVEPTHARILLAAAEEFRCLEEALTVVAFLASEPVFSQRAEQDEGDGHDNSELESFTSGGERHQDEYRQFYSPEGDHIRYVKIYRAYSGVNREESRDWCRSNGLTAPRMENVVRVREQLRQTCRDRKYAVESCANNFLPLRKAICYGLFQNACRYDPSAGGYEFLSGAKRNGGVVVKMHPSSCMARTGTVLPMFVFTDLVQTSGTYARGVCPVEKEWVEELINRSREAISERKE